MQQLLLLSEKYLLLRGWSSLFMTATSGQGKLVANPPRRCTGNFCCKPPSYSHFSTLFFLDRKQFFFHIQGRGKLTLRITKFSFFLHLSLSLSFTLTLSLFLSFSFSLSLTGNNRDKCFSWHLS